MSDEPDADDGPTERTVQMTNGSQLRVAETPDEADTVVTGVTVSGSQKENLGDYENVEPHTSIRAEFQPAINMSHLGAAEELDKRISELRDSVNESIEDGIERAKEPRTRD